MQLVAGACQRGEMAEHLIRLALHRRVLPPVLLELAQVTSIDEERNPAGYFVP